MNYDNITYPLDKIYSKATGVSYPVCAAGHDNAQPTPDPEPTSIYGELVITKLASVVDNYNFTASMECTEAMEDKIYKFEYWVDEDQVFELYLIPDSEDNTKLVMDNHNDSQMLQSIDTGERGVVSTFTIIDPTTWEGQIQDDVINWVCTEEEQ